MTTRDILLDKCRKVDPQNADEVIDEVARYCKKLGKRADPQEFIGEMNRFVQNAFSRETKQKIENLISRHSKIDDDGEDPTLWIQWADAVFGDTC